MTEKAYKLGEERNGIDVLDGKSCEDTSHFTKSDKKAPNLATYYFRHEDTDSDMDKVEQICNASKNDGQSTLEETSEEEWTYTKTVDKDEQMDYREGGSRVEELEDAHIVPKPKPIPEDTIRRLVQKAEELVSPEKCRKSDRTNSLSKMSRVNKWLSMDKPDDSCDASGEDDEKESQTSEELDASTATLREMQESYSQNTSIDELNSTNGNRPWRGSCISQLNEVSSSPG